MIKRILFSTLLAALALAHYTPARAQATPQYVNCVALTNTPCDTTNNPGNGSQGDLAWLGFGKLNLDITALQPPTPQYGVAYANGATYGSLLPGSIGTWCLLWTSLTAPPALITCPGGGGGGVSSFAFVNGNGFTGIVTNATSTPTLSLSMSFSGVAYSNGTGLAAATAANLYAPFGCTGVSTTFMTGGGGCRGINLATDVGSSLLSPANGGNGFNNGANQISLGGNLATSGGAVTIAVPGTTTVTIPVAGAFTPAPIGAPVARGAVQTAGGTIAQTDNGYTLYINCTSPCTWSLPTGLAVGTQITINAVAGSAAVTLTSAGDTVNSSYGAMPRTIPAQGIFQFGKYLASPATWQGYGAGGTT